MTKGMMTLLVTFMLLQLAVRLSNSKFIHISVNRNQTWPVCHADMKIKTFKQVSVGPRQARQISSQDCTCENGAIVKFSNGLYAWRHEGLLSCCEKCYKLKYSNCYSDVMHHQLCTCYAVHECICDCREKVLSVPIGDSESECQKKVCGKRGSCCIKNQCHFIHPKKRPEQD